MTRFALLLLCLAVPALAAPIPPESDRDKVARLWGKVESPPGEYVAKPDTTGKKLTLKTLGWPLGFRHTETKFRVVREVSGDFDVRVTVEALDAPDKTVKHDGSSVETGAGIVVAGGEHTVTAYRWKGFYRNPQNQQDPPIQGMIWVEQLMGRQGGQGSGSGTSDINSAVELRIVRRGEAITVHTREVGKEWRQSAIRADLKLTESVTVGLFVGHSTHMPCEATFSDYVVGKPDPKEAKPGDVKK